MKNKIMKNNELDKISGGAGKNLFSKQPNVSYGQRADAAQPKSKSKWSFSSLKSKKPVYIYDLDEND